MWLSRVLSIIAAISMVVMTRNAGASLADTGSYALFVLLPMSLIWFPEFFGDYIGPSRGFYINNPTPPFLVAAAGWFFLVGIPLIIWLNR